MSELPKKGERYKAKPLRGIWTITAVGPQEITLRSEIPGIGPTRIPTHSWSKGSWEKVS